MKGAKKFGSLGILFLFVIALFASGCACMVPVAAHVEPRALTPSSSAILFLPVKIIVPTVQTAISTTSRLLVDGVVKIGGQVKQATQKKHYEKKNS